MSLNFLLDENISQVCATQLLGHRPEVRIESVHSWHEGNFKGQADKTLLLAARTEELTLVTYDLRTIPTLLADLYAVGEAHSGVVLVDDATIANDDYGSLVRALAYCWDTWQDMNWTNRVYFLGNTE